MSYCVLSVLTNLDIWSQVLSRAVGLSSRGNLRDIWCYTWVVFKFTSQTAGMPVMKIQNEPKWIAPQNHEITPGDSKELKQTRGPGFLKIFATSCSVPRSDLDLHATALSTVLWWDPPWQANQFAGKNTDANRPAAKGQGGVVTCLVLESFPKSLESSGPLPFCLMSPSLMFETDSLKQRCCQPPLAKYETSKSCGTNWPVMSQRLHPANMLTSSFCSQHCACLNSMPNRSACNGATTMKNNKT